MESQITGTAERLEFNPSNAGSLAGIATPFNIPNGRPGAAWQIDEDTGYPKIVEYAGTVWEPGVFSRSLTAERSRVRFLYQHGDAGESWTGNPFGVNALPIGTLTDIREEDDGLHFAADFATNTLAQAVRELAATGALNELSIGYIIRDFELKAGADGKVYRHASDADLLDISVVVWGQYGLNATITEVQSINASPAAIQRAADEPSGVGADSVGESRARRLRLIELESRKE